MALYPFLICALSYWIQFDSTFGADTRAYTRRDESHPWKILIKPTAAFKQAKRLGRLW
jgi:hypothetical protein